MKNTKSSNKSFGIIFSIFFMVMTLYQYVKFDRLHIYFLLLSLFFLIFSFVYPKIFYPLNKIWIKFGYLLGKVISPIVMFIIYFTIVYATSIILKLFRKDIMDIKIDKHAISFWKKRKIKPGDMSKQF
tara:strand:- start:16700 stop:17083 length:384 start_codon:yes stop_codon:yes gene_type:complete